MNILIIGATRGIGKALLECALEEQHRITVLARNPDRIKKEHPNLQIIGGDIRDLNSLETAAAGMDAVCSCIGVPITFSQVDLFSTAAANLVSVITSNPGQKLVCITGIGAGDSKGHGGFLYDKIFNPLLLKTIYADKDREEEIIKKSSIDWMIVRPAGLTNGPRTGTYRVLNDLAGVTAKRISRKDVADFILRELAKPENFRKTPLITY